MFGICLIPKLREFQRCTTEVIDEGVMLASGFKTCRYWNRPGCFSPSLNQKG